MATFAMISMTCASPRPAERTTARSPSETCPRVDDAARKGGDGIVDRGFALALAGLADTLLRQAGTFAHQRVRREAVGTLIGLPNGERDDVALRGRQDALAEGVGESEVSVQHGRRLREGGKEIRRDADLGLDGRKCGLDVGVGMGGVDGSDAGHVADPCLVRVGLHIAYMDSYE